MTLTIVIGLSNKNLDNNKPDTEDTEEIHFFVYREISIDEKKPSNHICNQDIASFKKPQNLEHSSRISINGKS